MNSERRNFLSPFLRLWLKAGLLKALLYWGNPKVDFSCLTVTLIDHGIKSRKNFRHPFTFGLRVAPAAGDPYSFRPVFDMVTWHLIHLIALIRTCLFLFLLDLSVMPAHQSHLVGFLLGLASSFLIVSFTVPTSGRERHADFSFKGRREWKGR